MRTSWPKALIFDVDGTLADTEELHRRAFDETFRAFGLDWHWDEGLYRELLAVTGGKERIRYYVAKWRPSEEAQVLPHVAELHRAKTERYTAMVREGQALLRPGIGRIVREAMEAGVRLAIATTTSLPNVTALLDAAFEPAARGSFEVIVGGDMVAAKKPAPDVYVEALSRLGLAASECVAFEDSYNGVVAAHRAGLATIATPSLYTRDDDLGQALAVVSNLGEPGAPYVHLAGAGAGEGLVTIEALGRWAGVSAFA